MFRKRAFHVLCLAAIPICNKALCQDFLIQVLKVSAVIYVITFSRITMSVVTCYVILVSPLKWWGIWFTCVNPRRFWYRHFPFDVYIRFHQSGYFFTQPGFKMPSVVHSMSTIIILIHIRHEKTTSSTQLPFVSLGVVGNDAVEDEIVLLVLLKVVPVTVLRCRQEFDMWSIWSRLYFLTFSLASRPACGLSTFRCPKTSSAYPHCRLESFCPSRKFFRVGVIIRLERPLTVRNIFEYPESFCQSRKF